MNRRVAAVVVALGLLALVVLRLVLIHASLSEVINWEEPYRLTIATELLAGPHWPLTDYQADDYQAGSIVMGLLAAPLVAVLGPTYETLKLVPLAFTLFTAAGWALLLWRWVSPVSAVLVVWSFALAPPMAQIYQVHAMGSHAESALFTVAEFLLVLAMLAPGLSTARLRRRAFLLGGVAGLGLWYCYSAASGIVAWGLVWLLLAPVGALRASAVPLLAGGVVGLTPWLVYNLENGFRGLERVVELFGSRGTDLAPYEPFLERVAALFGIDLVRALGFAETIPGLPDWPAWAAYALAATLVVALAALALRARTGDSETPIVARFVVLTIAVHLGAYVMSTFRCDVENGFIAYRFFAPLFPLVAAGSAIVLAQPSSGVVRGVTGGVAFVMLGLGMLGTAELLRERPARPLPLPTHADALMGQATLLKHRSDPARGLALIAALDEPRRSRVYFGFGWGLEFRYEKDGDWERFVRALDTARPDERRAVLAGATWAVRTRERQVRRFANARFLTDHSHALHTRIVDLAAQLKAFESGAAAPAIGG